ncbi:MAG: flagellar hook capping protein [Ignavibacteriae bacterium]|nr:flagellar hook capping protein [Ignavibacteriota bacterium]NOG97142.1 flagellar hook capping protein [Ignavibacteriota bacterium]
MVNTIGSIGGGSTQAQGNSSLGKNEFLELLIAQLKNQDPLNPMEGTEFASQLAEFSSLEQLSNLNDSMTESIDANYYLTQSINNTMTATLIGKDVKLSNPHFEYKGQSEISLGYNLPVAARSVDIKIYNEEGALVKTIKNAPTTSGNTKVSWDFTDNDGNTVPNTNYRFEVEAKNNKDEKMAIETFIWGKIDGVKFTNSGSKILVNGVEYRLSDITEILNPTVSTNTDPGPGGDDTDG